MLGTGERKPACSNSSRCCAGILPLLLLARPLRVCIGDATWVAIGFDCTQFNSNTAVSLEHRRGLTAARAEVLAIPLPALLLLLVTWGLNQISWHEWRSCSQVQP